MDWASRRRLAMAEKESATYEQKKSSKIDSFENDVVFTSNYNANNSNATINSSSSNNKKKSSKVEIKNSPKPVERMIPIRLTNELLGIWTIPGLFFPLVFSLPVNSKQLFD